MDIEIIECKEKYIKMKIKNEDHTLGNILQKALLDDERILGAGFYIPHPLHKELVFEVFFNEELPVEERKRIILENVEAAKKYILDIKERLKGVLEEREK
jgi:DNA-directed RNA polymerase II subunit RPB11